MSQLDRLIAGNYRVTLRSTGFATLLTVSRPGEAMRGADGEAFCLHITGATSEVCASEALKWLGLEEVEHVTHHA